MFKILLKKQMAEIFRAYFYDVKKNKACSKVGTVVYLALYVVLMFGVIGGMFAYVAYALCEPLATAHLGWLYFVMMSLIATALGVFGSVFNTYVGLYLSKDNDLLFSMPIPTHYIMTARLTSVYLMGLLYSAIVILPAMIVYVIVASVTVMNIIGMILMILMVSVIVLTLSCALGWVIAKISVKLKNKSFITVIVSLAFIAAYYYVYFNAQQLLNSILMNVENYAEKIRGFAYPLYVFGKVGEGDFISTVLSLAAVGAIFALTWYVMERSFMKIATSTGTVRKTKTTDISVKEKSLFGTLLHKELKRFTESPNYMLNCGLGIIFVPILGVLILIKGASIYDIVSEAFGMMTESAVGGLTTLVLCAMLCFAASLNDVTAPSVSLEGKSLWIIRSMPVATKQVLTVKLSVQILLTCPVILFCSICSAIVMPIGLTDKLLVIIVPQLYAVFTALSGLFFGVTKANLNWTNEIIPIKQSMGVLFSLLLNMAFAGLPLVAFFIFGTPYPIIYINIGVLAVANILLYQWLIRRGVTLFESF